MLPFRPARVPVPEETTALAENPETPNVRQSKAESKWIPHVSEPEPTPPSIEPVKVSVPCPRMWPVLQSMICSKFEMDLPVRLPVYWDTKPVVVQRRMSGDPLGAQDSEPKSEASHVPET